MNNDVIANLKFLDRYQSNSELIISKINLDDIKDTYSCDSKFIIECKSKIDLNNLNVVDLYNTKKIYTEENKVVFVMGQHAVKMKKAFTEYVTDKKIVNLKMS
ncbi:hypothetical protein SCLARK_001198 [Spiroplasma clarkii]|uniref:Uncharacterized protein n=1 Tax=Spiroplasma clarkii TaxID=2139 RepID=A0A1Y0L1Z5_9MOLU|nr:hypothetical protein [Spiroplasma clarkii]ARU91755.1 hypothetical protein SCLARK_001198 [Spiroplasma clarkii]ATX71129.1 hypothetical protein SCLAR_v1c08170 [Spiroplasma clarkii]